MQAKLALTAALAGALMVSVSTAEQVRLLRPDRAYDFLAEGYDSPAVVTAVAVTAGGERIAASGDDHAIRLWDVKSGATPHILRGHRDWVRDLKFDAEGARLASVGDDHATILWDTATLQPILTNHEAKGPIGSVAFLSGGQQVLTAAFGDKLRLLHTSSGVVDKEFACPCKDTRVMAVSSASGALAAGGRNGSVRLWNLRTGDQGKTLPADTRRIQAIAFSHDGLRMATGGDGAVVRLWDVTTGDLMAELPMQPSKTRSLAFLKDGRLAVGGTDNHVHLWDLARKQRTHRLVGHTGTVTAIAESGTGDMIATAGYDTTIMLWRLPATQQDATAQTDTTTVR